MSENTAPNIESIEALFVQCAHGLTSNNGSVTFHGLAHEMSRCTGSRSALARLWNCCIG
jgi:hypothetical protein